MIEVKKISKTPITVIRTASSQELSNYEKHKLATIEENAQENKIELISVNGQRVQIDAKNKEAKITLGDLAFKSYITPDELSKDMIFFLKCELDEDFN